MNNSDGNGWGFWKIVAVLMIAFNILLLFLFLWKFNLATNIRDAAGSIDSAVVFSLTLLQTIIALGAFSGFWMIKYSAESKAREAGQEVAKKIANDRMTIFIQQQEAEKNNAPENQQSKLIEATPPDGATESGDCE